VQRLSGTAHPVNRQKNRSRRLGRFEKSAAAPIRKGTRIKSYSDIAISFSHIIIAIPLKKITYTARRLHYCSDVAGRYRRCFEAERLYLRTDEKRPPDFLHILFDTDSSIYYIMESPRCSFEKGWFYGCNEEAGEESDTDEESDSGEESYSGEESNSGKESDSDARSDPDEESDSD